jgi:hypothetical protein
MVADGHACTSLYAWNVSDAEEQEAMRRFLWKDRQQPHEAEDEKLELEKLEDDDCDG